MTKPLMKYRCPITLPNSGEVIETWGIYPISNDSKILDGLYNPITKELQILFDSHLESYRQVEVPVKNKSEVQIRKIDDWYRGTLTHEEDINYFLHTYVNNNFEYTYQETKKIITPDEYEAGKTRGAESGSNRENS